MKKIMIAVAVAVLAQAEAKAETVFTQDNEAGANHILSYKVGGDGTLSPQFSVATGGKGFVDSSFALGPFDSDQEVITNSNQTLLFTVNGGSNSISVFHLSASGRLTAVKGSPFASHGSQPASLGLNGRRLTVVNKHGDPAQASDSTLPNYTNFEVRDDGSLTWIPDSTVKVAAGASPSQALVHENWPYVFGADFLGGKLESFRIASNGQFTQNPPQMLPASLFPDDNGKTPHAPLGLAVHPRKNLVYVGLPTVNKIAVYRFDRTGQLHFIRAIDDSGSTVCWLVTNLDGTRLYASNTADPSLTVYDISQAQTPREIQKLKLQSQGAVFQIALSPNGRHLGAVTERDKAATALGHGNGIQIFNVDDSGQLSFGSATEIGLPGDTRIQGIVFKE